MFGEIEVIPGQYNDDMLTAIKRGIDPSNFEQMKNYYESLDYFDKPTQLFKMFEDETLKAPINFKK
jgi:hypothetical protein